MTTVDVTEVLDENRTEGYRDAVQTTPDEDREYASTLATHVIEVVKAFGAIKGRLHGQGQADGLDFALVIRLAKSGPMRASDLAEQLCADPSTVSRQVASLVKAGLIERRADPNDGRASILVPTDAGLERIESWVRMRGQIIAPIIADWPAGDRELFVRMLAEFAAGLTANLESVKNIAAELIQHGALARRNA